MSTNPGRIRSATDSARDAHQRLLLGDRYRLDAVIGHGGMGQVWRGWDELLGREVAVKELHDRLRDDAATERFSLEARTAARLNDPHVVSVYDFGADQDRLYLVMELVTGHSLAQEVEGAVTLAAPRVAALGAQVAAGLATAHRHGVVHRDIKPGNLLLDEQGNVSIADFGIARFTQGSTAALAPTADGQVLGTVAYLSPERALGRPATTASDVYALGCVLYQLLTGAPPFTADLPAAILYQHVHGEPAPPRRLNPEIPPSLAQFVLSLLSKDPAERPTAKEAATWLRQWSVDPAPTHATAAAIAAPRPLDGAASGPETGTRSPATPPGSKRRPLLVTGLAVAALGAATVGILGLSDPIDHTGRQPTRSHPAAAPSHPASVPAATRSTASPVSTTKSPRPAPSASPSTSASLPPVTSPIAKVDTAAPRHGNDPRAKEPKKPKKPKEDKKES